MVLLQILLLGLVIFFLWLYYFFTKQYNYWKNKGIPAIKPTIPFGNVYDIMFGSKSLPEAYGELYQKLDGVPYGGMYQIHKPMLLIRDPDLIRNILVKDFESFYGRGLLVDEELDPLSANLFTLDGARWKDERNKLSPTFTSGKMKMMFQIMAECGQELQEYMKESATANEMVNVKDILTRLGIDVVASCAFGLTCNSLKNPDNDFRKWVLKIFNRTTTQVIKGTLSLMLPTLMNKLRISPTDTKLTVFFQNLVRDVVEEREKHGIVRKDFMQLLIQLKNVGSIDPDSAEVDKVAPAAAGKYGGALTMDQITSHALTFFIAGLENTAATVSFCLYELAINFNIQTQVHDEIDNVLEKHGGKLTYDALKEMTYLNKVLSEVLRIYAPAFIGRECNRDYKVPGSDLVLEKGIQVVIPIYGMHHDPKYYPQPEKFDPERFNDEEKAKRHHYTYLPFGEGPRVCIGMRFAIVNSLVNLVSLLSMYEFHPCKKTTIPIKCQPKAFISTPEGGELWLRIQHREKSFN